MGRSRGKTPRQILRKMSRGLPLPVRMFINSRLGLPIVVIGLPALLLLTGIVTWNWDGGKPEITVDRERVEEVEARVAETVDSWKGRLREGLAEHESLRAPDGSFNPFWSAGDTLAEPSPQASPAFGNLPSLDLRPGGETDEQPAARQSLFGRLPSRQR